MKNQVLLTAVIAFLFASCSKQQESVSPTHDDATVLQVKYACGANCMATTWIIQTVQGSDYEPVNLPEKYKINALGVKVLYRKTGQRSFAGQGLGEEKVEILEISRK
jgi:hypothetical protein